jgi:hypothetical protein
MEETALEGSIRETAISVVNQRIAELEILQSGELAPADFEIDRRVRVCQSLLGRLRQAPEPECRDAHGKDIEGAGK